MPCHAMAKDWHVTIACADSARIIETDHQTCQSCGGAGAGCSYCDGGTWYRAYVDPDREKAVCEQLKPELARLQQQIEPFRLKTPEGAPELSHLTDAVESSWATREALRLGNFEAVVTHGQRTCANLLLAQEAVLDRAPHRMATRTLSQVDEALAQGAYDTARAGLNKVAQLVNRLLRDLSRLVERDGPER